MKAIQWVGLALLTLLSFVLTPIIMFLVLPFVRKDPDNVLPKWLAFLNTYDDPGMDQGMNTTPVGIPIKGKYEQQVKDVFDDWGWYIKTWYWLGVRNQMYTLFNWLAPTIGEVTKTDYTNWKTLTSDGYFLVLNKNVDVGFGWKLFNAPGKCSFYFRPRFWKKPSN